MKFDGNFVHHPISKEFYFNLFHLKSGQVLGSDILECLSWRRGALFYMYCHTLFNDPQRRQLDTTHVMQVLS